MPIHNSDRVRRCLIAFLFLLSYAFSAQAGHRISHPPVWMDSTPPAVLSMTINTQGADVAVVLTEPATAGLDGFTSSWTIYYDDYFFGEIPLATLTYVSGTGTNTLHFMPSITILSDAHLVATIGPITRGEFVQPGNGIKDAAGNLLSTNGSIVVTNNSTK